MSSNNSGEEDQLDSPRSPAAKKMSIEDFRLNEILGEGAYGQVVLGNEIATGIDYAIKILSKRHIYRQNKVKYVKMERNAMNRLHHPSVINLFYTFQDAENLYFVMELAPGGDLLSHLVKHHTLSTECTRFYMAECVNGLAHLFENNVLHRDLKPENVLLSGDLHAKLSDFGTAKFIDDTESLRTRSFVGTAEYVSPEVLDNKPASPASDLWALGCMVYQCLAGRPPFRGPNEYQIFQLIMKVEFSFPDEFPADAADLVTSLLKHEPSERLGAKNMNDLKSHPFFKGICWGNMHNETPPVMASGSAGSAEESEDDELANDDLLDSAGTKEEVDNWKRFLLEGESLIFSGIVVKSKGLSKKTRRLMLTSFPRLVYFDPDKMSQKGEVPWSEKLYAEAKNSKVFHLVVPGRKYNFQDLSGNARRWVELITKIQERRANQTPLTTASS